MGSASDSTTSLTLLCRLRQIPPDPEAWQEFVERYGQRIYAWGRQWKLQDADAQDVTQDILLKLLRTLQTFTYDPSRSFRSWLRKVAQRTLQDFVESNQRCASASGHATPWVILESVEAKEDLAQRLDKEFDRELFDEAKARVQLRIKPKTWEAFRMLALEDRSGAEVAAALGMTVTQALMAKSRVKKMLQDVMAQLEGKVRDREEGPS